MQEPPESAASPRQGGKKVKAEGPWVTEETDGTVWVNYNRKEISITQRGAAVLGLQLPAGDRKPCNFQIHETMLKDASQRRQVLELKSLQPKGKTVQREYCRLVSHEGTTALVRACGLDPRKLARLKMRTSDDHVDILEAEVRKEIASENTIDVTNEGKTLQQKGSQGDKAAKQQTTPPVPGRDQEAARAPVGATAESAGCAAAARRDQVRRSKTPWSRSICMLTCAVTHEHIKIPTSGLYSVLVRLVYP